MCAYVEVSGCVSVYYMSVCMRVQCASGRRHVLLCDCVSVHGCECECTCECVGVRRRAWTLGTGGSGAGGVSALLRGP